MYRFKYDQAKSWYLDSARVTKLISVNARRGLLKYGSYVRVVSRNSIKRKKGVSDTGKPPHAHAGHIKRILFSYDPERKSVVIGPVVLNQVGFGVDGQPTKGTVPSVLENSGTIIVEEVQNPLTGNWWRRDMRYKRAGGQASWRRRRRKVEVKARSFMGPANERSLPKLPDYLRNTLTRS